MFWNPAAAAEKKKSLPASYHELRVRFVKETSLKKSELFPDVDQMDVAARQENLPLGGQPILLQIPLVPAYAPPRLQSNRTYNRYIEKPRPASYGSWPLGSAS